MQDEAQLCVKQWNGFGCGSAVDCVRGRGKVNGVIIVYMRGKKRRVFEYGL